MGAGLKATAGEVAATQEQAAIANRVRLTPLIIPPVIFSRSRAQDVMTDLTARTLRHDCISLGGHKMISSATMVFESRQDLTKKIRIAARHHGGERYFFPR